MKKLLVLSFLGVSLSLAVASQEKDKDPKEKPSRIKMIMQQAHQGKSSPFLKLRDEVSKEQWEFAKKDSAELVKLAEELGKCSPKRGEKASWDRLTASYRDTVDKLKKACNKEDRENGLTVLGVLAKSCGECHQAHK